ncbi:NAD(P)-dependent alcohol dehydrogenase [Flavobacterium sp. HSC-61S13]|uniref:zinc-dependent alcohol dehydrogenase family protein n=1 Tax=Flavobacterium sp. HSC-61S13 TaxID=2910963 RepID=UPI00209F7658|nr:NAD(P)-dependent alcohol dehydrogenase [Flavobacterium sp. HSC-61S13]MCP1997043.1 NADPH:quinone reductase-like Zn-dependent oxidoreductase [Flavobacterium sp. HSC-61S13]
MKTIVIKNSYGLGNISVEERAIPAIKPNEVLVHVKSMALNQLDLMIAQGAFGTRLPHVLGSDAAGIVESVGSEVQSLKIGDRVSTHFIQSWQSGPLREADLSTRLGTTMPGVFSEYIALPASSLVKISSHFTLEQASTLPIAALTAWEALVHVGQLKVGQTVLLQGTGGVSIFALQFAKALGAKVIILSSSDDKLIKAKQLGADETINYKVYPDWEKRVLELTNGQGVDLSLEMAWGTLEQTITSMKLGGKIVVIGLMAGSDVNLSVFGVLQKSLTIQGIQIGSKRSFEQMIQAIEDYKMNAIIDKVFPVTALAAALEYFNQGKHFGKVVLNF